MKSLKRIPFNLFFMLCLLLLTVGLAFVRIAPAAQNETVRILSRTERSLTLEFTVSAWKTDTTEVKGEQWVRFDFAGAGLVDEPGKPQIPYHVVIAGIPVGAQVQHSIVESDFSVEPNKKILPFASPDRVEGLTGRQYIFDQKIYDSPDAFPAQLVQVEEPAFFRDQQICRVQVAGLQYFPKLDDVRKYHRVVVHLQFVGGQAGDTGSKIYTRAEESLFANTLINYVDAKKWRKRQPTTRGLPKRQGLFSQNGVFYKINIREEGIYRIDASTLQSMNIDLSQINPANIRLFNNGGRELPRDLNALRPEGLVENAIRVNDGGDGNFGQNDFILFYGRGVTGWAYDLQTQSYSHYINHYGFDNVYWLNLDGSVPGRRMAEVSAAPQAGPVREESQGLYFREDELDNPLRSGLNWFGRQFATDEVSRNQTFTFDLPNAVLSSTDRLKFRFVSRSPQNHRFDIALNGNAAQTHQFVASNFDIGGQYVVMTGSQFESTFANQVNSGVNSLQLTYSHTQTSGQALLDWFELFYRAQLRAADNELRFSVIPETGQVTYRLSNFSGGDMQVFDVTDYASVKRLSNFTVSSGTITFADLQNANAPKRYLALTASKHKPIESLERVEFRDLRSAGLGAEFIIITHDDFQVEAQRLESLRENGSAENRLDTEVVLVSQIYNNFSGGLVDPTAIRDFLRFALNNWAPSPSYVLLLGDGDYDYKNIISTGDKNWIPPYQTDAFQFNSPSHRPTLRELTSRTTDSWFTYVSGNDVIMDLAIGRINVQTLADAKNAIDKIVNYETHPLRGNWRNTVTVVGDDELVAGGRATGADAIHIVQIEEIAEDYIPSTFDIEKIYLPEYPRVVSASVGGITKPAAQDALLRQMNKGTLIVNFVGHGNDRQWAHEVVFEQSDNDLVQNGEKLIFFVAATCDWALHDNPQRQSQAEELLLAENRGAIAILTAARLVFSQSNFRFNQLYYENLFTGNATTSRLGDAFVAARIRRGSSPSAVENDEKFHIYGDPTLRLAVPRHEAVIVSVSPDSILALSTMAVSGEIRIDGQLATDYSGKALLNTFDSKRFVNNIPEAGFPQTYFLPGNSIYRGTVPVQNGRFTAKFIVPKDISYGGNLARISTYFWNDETDGAGSLNNISVSSSSSDLVDTEGPQLQIYFRGHENFTTGDIVGENVTLVVDLADTVSGINIAGEIGHRLTLNIDPDEETCISQLNQFRGVTTIDLTDLFQFREGDHLRGTVEFPLTFPKEVDIAGNTIDCVGQGGEDRHTLVVKAWDNANNSSTASVEVLVAHEEGLVLQDVLNYPNPFRDNTTFTFITNQEAEVTIKIYTVAGHLVHTLEYPLARSGFNMVEWDGRDADGDIPANGVYLYKLIARAPGEAALVQREVIGRIAIVR